VKLASKVNGTGWQLRWREVLLEFALPEAEEYPCS